MVKVKRISARLFLLRLARGSEIIILLAMMKRFHTVLISRIMSNETGSFSAQQLKAMQPQRPQGKMIRGPFSFWEIRGMFNSRANSRRLGLYR